MRKDFHIIMDSARMMWQLDRTVFLTAVSAAAIAELIPFIGILLSGYVLDELVAGAAFPGLICKAAAAVGGVFLLTTLASYLDRQKEIHTEICVRKFDMKPVERTLTMDYELLDSPKLNEIRERINRDNNWGSGFYSVVWIIPKLMSHLFALVVSVIIMVPLFLTGGMFSDPLAIVLMLAFLLVLGWNGAYSQKNKKEYYRLLNTPTKEQYFGYFLWRNKIDYRMGKDVRIYGAEPMIRHYVERDQSRLQWIHDTTKNTAKGGLVNGLSSGILMLVSYLFVVIRTIAGGLGVGSLVKYASTIYRFSDQLRQLIDSYTEAVVITKRQQSTMEYMNVPDILYKGTLPVEKRDDNEYEIEFCDVSFRYPGATSDSLKHVSMKLKIGQKMAVVGMNGSGKTTFIKLLCRLYDPTQGEIRLNGIDIKKYNLQEYQSIFSVVFQDFKLFSFSIGDNVAASMDYDKDRVEDCLRKVGFGKRLDSLKDGCDTYLYKDFESGGVEISGGEAQKIAIARALYHDSPFIVLDEPTAALDPISEAEIYSGFNQIVGDKTALYISHRLSSCRFCDNILVFDHGKIIQQGNHDSLVSDESGKYYELWQAQAQYYQKEEEQEQE